MRWGAWARVYSTLAADNARHRLSWISVRPPAPGVRGWKAVARGKHDHAIYALARQLAARATSPALISFDDDPTDAAEEDGRIWAAAYCRFHDIVAAATGVRMVGRGADHQRLAVQPREPAQNPENWLTEDVLERSVTAGGQRLRERQR